MKNPISCNSRKGTYKNGKTFEDCKEEARRTSSILSEELLLKNEISWNRILEASNHDEIVYKLTLKYLREVMVMISGKAVLLMPIVVLLTTVGLLLEEIP